MVLFTSNCHIYFTGTCGGPIVTCTVSIVTCTVVVVVVVYGGGIALSIYMYQSIYDSTVVHII